MDGSAKSALIQFVGQPERRTKILEHLRVLLFKRREELDFSMSHLAERSGLSQQTISYIERGLRDPTVDSLLRIAEALEVEASDLLVEAEVLSERSNKKDV